MRSSTTRQMGWAMRIYRNAEDKIIATDCIAIDADKRRINKERFHRSAYMDYDRELYHLGTGGRIIAKIQMIGDYNSIEDSSGNYENATWDAASANENDVTIDFRSLPKVGDVI